jgi:hypothetical protein
LGGFFILAGLFTLAGAVFEWDFYWRSSKARFWEALLGRLVARTILALVGLALTALGAGAMLGY